MSIHSEPKCFVAVDEDAPYSMCKGKFEEKCRTCGFCEDNDFIEDMRREREMEDLEAAEMMNNLWDW